MKKSLVFLVLLFVTSSTMAQRPELRAPPKSCTIVITPSEPEIGKPWHVQVSNLTPGMSGIVLGNGFGDSFILKTWFTADAKGQINVDPPFATDSSAEGAHTFTVGQSRNSNLNNLKLLCSLVYDPK